MNEYRVGTVGSRFILLSLARYEVLHIHAK